jgi:uncharacterized protein (DUF736 family)
MSSISERATARRREQRDRTPDYVVRARQGRGWQTVGAGWKSDREDSGVIASIKVNSLPVGFDGTLKVMLPLPDEDEQQPD